MVSAITAADLLKQVLEKYELCCTKALQLGANDSALIDSDSALTG